MEIHTKNTQTDDTFGLAKNIIITSFRQVSIFGKNYTKIVYCHSPNSFSIEKIGDNVDPDNNVQSIMGPRAEEIITELIKNEKKKGATFIWSGARFKNQVDESLLKEEKENNWKTHGFYGIPRCWDPLIRDFVETEEERRQRLKEEREDNIRKLRRGIVIH